MGVRFVLGRAGSGKTAHCLDEIRRRLRVDPAEGPRLILLVPEQASFQMERALIESPDIAGFCRCEVLSFRRLAYRVLGTAGGAAAKALSKTGRMMLLRHLLSRYAGSLRVYGKVRDTVGLLRQLAGCFAEMINEQIAPAELAAACRDDEPEHHLLYAKLHDVAVLYQAYLDALGTERLDPAQYLELARDRLADCPWLTEAEVWVDGFAGLTRQEQATLVELARLVGRMEITLLMDPASPVVGDPTAPIEPFHLFARTERTYVGLHEAFRGAGVSLESPLLLEPQVPPRFEPHHPLAQLERGLFRTPPAAGTGQAGQPVRPRSGSADRACVRLIEAANRRVEVDAAVAHIQELVQRRERPLRYRQIAVIVRSLEPYHDLLSAALDAHGIPYFIDRRRGISHHAAVELIRSLARLVAEDFSCEAVGLLVKTGLLPIRQDEADAIENYVLAHGVQGRQVWERQEWGFVRRMSRGLRDDEPTEPERVQLAKINAIRSRILAALEPWLAVAGREEPAPARGWAAGLYACLERLEVPQRLEAWAVQAEDDGRLDEAAEHRQLWRDLIELLDDMVDAVGDEPMTAQQFAASLEAGLSELTVGLTPPTLDQVLVGSIERSRHPELEAVLVLGLNERLFPLAGSEDVIFGDADREHLASQGLELGPTRQQRLFDEKLLAYIAMTRPSRQLWVSYAAADEYGRELAPSPFVEALRAALPEIELERRAEPAGTRQTWAIGTADELAEYVALEFRRRPPRSDDDRTIRAVWNAIYETARSQEGLRRPLAAALAGLVYSNDEAQLDPDAIAALYGQAFVASVTRLETFAACPFRHFAAYGLQLEERATAEISAIDLGVLHHAILEHVVADLCSERRSLADLDDDELAQRIETVARRIVPRLADELVLGDARNAYLLEQSNRELNEVLKAQRFAAQAGRFRPIATELHFGFPDSPGSLEPLVIETPGGHRLAIRGKIDRVDVAELAQEFLGVVVDYKHSAHRRLDLAEVYHGLSLQLIGYLLVLQQRGESLVGRPIRPVAAFYVNLVPQYERVDHPDQAGTAEPERYKPHKPRGLFDFAHLELFDRNAPVGGWSQVVSAFRTKSGSLGYADSSDALERGQLEAVLDYTRDKIGHLADELLDGRIAVEPYRLNDQMPCRFCCYGSVCRFEFGTQWPRGLERGRRQDFLDRMTQHRRQRR